MVDPVVESLIQQFEEIEPPAGTDATYLWMRRGWLAIQARDLRTLAAAVVGNREATDALIATIKAMTVMASEELVWLEKGRQRKTNKGNAKKPRHRKLPPADELRAELVEIMQTQHATEDEARAILHTRYPQATPAAINTKLRQLNDR